jgi:DNA-binding SARP family transcriptional activator/tetratricopeptide (TPR) repeat protein
VLVGKDVSIATAGSPQIELRLAGTFGVIRGGTELPESEVGSRKSRTLLKLLAVERPALVPVDRIVEVLWAGESPAAAEQNVASLVSRLRGVLGAGIIVGGRQGYRLTGEPRVGVDLDAAARCCERAERTLPASPAIALAAAEQAMGLLSADVALAEEPYATWAGPAREQLRRLLRRGRLTAAEAALAIGEAGSAARCAEAALAADPLDETACRWYMSASAAAGEPARALVAYEALRGTLAGELGADPAPQTQELHLAILRERDRDRAGWPQARSAPPAGSVPRSRPGQRDRHRRMLAGRDREAGALREAWDRAVAGGSGLVMIVGEAGIGKTALAEDLAADVDTDGATVLRTRCYEAERSLFLQPLAEAIAPIVSRMPASALRQLLGEHAPALAALLPEAAALLGPSPPWHASPDMERRRSFQAVTAFLAGLADRSPVLLVVDDLQYAGQSTVEFLHYLGRQASGSRLLTVVTVRAEHDAEIGSALAPAASRLEVGPLSAAAVEQLATQAGQGALAGPILQRTRGHTLFVVEVLRALAAGDTGPAQGAQAILPESLRSAVQARVRRTGTATESLLRAASVLGAAIDPLTLGELLELTPAAAVDLCEQAFGARLLVVSGRDYEFANDLIREVLYATTPEPTRLVYHRRAADLLTGQPEALARHATAAGDWKRATRAWLLAAEDAMRRSAASDAITLSSQALEAAERAGDTHAHARALILRGRAREAAGAHVTALTDLTLGAADARAAGDRRLEMLALRELGGDVPASRGLPISFYVSNLERGLRIAESTGDRAIEADLLGRLAIIAANRLRLDEALDYGLRAVAAARASADSHALAAGLDGLKTAYLSLGDVRGLAGVLAELDPLLRRLGDMFRLQWAEFDSAFPFIAAGQWGNAVSAMETALEANRRGGYPHCAVWYTAHLGWLARLRGHDDDAMALGQRSLAMTEQLEHTWWKPAACAIFGVTLLGSGDQAGAVEVLERGLAVAEQAGVEAYLLRCAAPLADATGSPAVLARAEGLLAQATIPADGAWLLGEESYLCLARAWLKQDDAERARAIVSPLLTVADRVPWTATLAAALALDGRALLRLGDSDQARAQLLRAERIAAEHGLPHVRHDAQSALHSIR